MNIELLQSLHKKTDDAFGHLRQTSFDALLKKGLPTVRSEEWRYTNLQSIDMNGKTWALHNDNKKDLKSLGVEPIFEKSLRIVIADCVEDSFNQFTKKIDTFKAEGNELVLLNASFLGGAREIHIPANQKVTAPIEIFYFNSKNAFANNRLNIIIEENATAKVIEHFYGEENVFANYVTTITVKDNAVLHHSVIQNESKASDHINTVTIDVGAHAEYVGFSLGLGAKVYRRDISVAMQGEHSNVVVSGAHLVGENQHMDATLVTTHAVKNGESSQHYKTILKENGKGVFQGKIKVERGADFTNAHQLNNALLLSDKAQMNAKPELIIYADEVQCSHGATTGQIDESALFYLRSRGLSKNEANKLLIEAFVGEVLNDIKEDTCRRYIREMVNEWLNTK